MRGHIVMLTAVGLFILALLAVAPPRRSFIGSGLQAGLQGAVVVDGIQRWIEAR